MLSHLLVLVGSLPFVAAVAVVAVATFYFHALFSCAGDDVSFGQFFLFAFFDIESSRIFRAKGVVTSELILKVTFSREDEPLATAAAIGPLPLHDFVPSSCTGRYVRMNLL